MIKKYLPYISLVLISILSIDQYLLAQDLVADNMLLFQRSYGGWPKEHDDKKVDYTTTYTAAQIAAIKNDYHKNDGTIDNEATTKEINYLLEAYKKHSNTAYLLAAEKGVDYLLKAQYKNGGWPQFYPNLSSYKHNITYNDNAIANVMNLLYNVSLGINNGELVKRKLAVRARRAVKRGIDCMLKTQIIVDGKLTAWCQQHDEVTFKPAAARKFELVGLTAHESSGILLFLMRLDNPSKQVIQSVHAGVNWLKQVQINGFVYKDTIINNQKDRLAFQNNKGIIWARYYDIDTNKPFFAGRDGIKRWNLSEVELERRVGYAWYGKWPMQVLKQYEEWSKKYAIE